MVKKFSLKEIDWQKLALQLLPYLAIFIMITLMISWQLNKHATFITADRYLHFYRFYDTKMQLLTGNFSYFQTNYAFYHSGRIFNALYGPLFAYLNGFLVITCHTWYRYQILIDYVVLLIGGVGMYHLGLKVKTQRLLALLLALIYLQFGILVGILRANNFMAWGAAIAPYFMIQAVNMIRDRNRPFHWLTIAILVSMMAQVHLLSTVILILTWVPFAIYALWHTPAKKQMLLVAVKSVALALVLTANVWSAFLILKAGNNISLPKAFDLTQSTVHLSYTLSSHGRLLPLMVILLLVQVVYVISHWRESTFNSFATLVAVVFIFASSSYFPWKAVQQAFPVLKQAFQFSYRLTVGAWPLLLAGAGISCTQFIKRHPVAGRDYVMLALIFVLLQNFGANTISNHRYSMKYNNPHQVIAMGNHYQITKNRLKIAEAVRWGSDSKLFKLATRSESDYLPLQGHPSLKKINSLYRHGIIDQNKYYHYRVKGSSLILNWHSRRKEERRLPVVMYQQSHLTVNGQDSSAAPKNAISLPLIKARKGSNQAVLHFQTPAAFWLLLLATVISWFILLIKGILQLLKRKSN